MASASPLIRDDAPVSSGLRARQSIRRRSLDRQLLQLRLQVGRTNIVIDDDLMKEALRATGLQTKREVVELGLRTLIRLGRQQGIRSLRGKLTWHGDLDAMRADK